MVTWYWKASCKWISCVACSTATDGIVIDNLATSILTTCAWTGISTFAGETGMCQWAFCTDHTLWPTRWWTSN